MNTTTSGSNSGHEHVMSRVRDDEFPRVAEYVRENLSTFKPPFFRTATKNLYRAYLRGFAVAERQSHTCNACRHFIEKYGSLVSVLPDGTKTSVFWGQHAPEPYRKSVAAMAKLVEEAPIEDVFLSSDRRWGAQTDRDPARNCYWSHFLVDNPAVFEHPLLSADQRMAERREEYGMLERGLSEFSYVTVDTAVTLLQSEDLYRGEKILGVAEWLQGVQQSLGRRINADRRANLLWAAVASAPAGFCHVKASMIGSLLEDIQRGLPIAIVKRRFAEKMDPLKYQRAQVPPKAGNVAQAEVVVEKLRAAGALDRRFAKLEDIQKIWTPRPLKPARRVAHLATTRGIFASLAAQVPSTRIQDAGASPVPMTWEKFARTVLPTAESIECYVPHTANFIALVTASNPHSTPILQWDREDERNTVSWYVYNGKSQAYRWNLQGGSWCKVNAVSTLPSSWGSNPPPNHGRGAILILDGARDLHHTASGGFFTEMLKSEFHGVRSTLEAYMLKAPIDGKTEASACGIDLRQGGTWDVVVRVISRGVSRSYSLQRWD